MIELITASRTEHRWKQVNLETSTSSISFTWSNLDINQLFWWHWIQLIQNYNHVFQSMWDSQRAYVDSSKKRTTTRRMIIQRSESFQSRLLDQICRFFDYFESIEFNSIRVTIMSLKVCEIVSAQKLIQVKKDDDSWAIEQSKSSIFFIAVVESNLHIFELFLKRWSRLSRLYNCCHRKYQAQARLVKIQDRWWIDRKADDESMYQDDHHRNWWKHHLFR